MQPSLFAQGVVLAIHGGAGAIRQDLMPEELRIEFLKGLDQALSAGWDALQSSGSSLEAVTQAVISLEDCPLFNAGRGAVYTHEGRIELDASIMEGAQRRAGAVAGVVGVRNPVLLARCVMERSDHVLLMGSGAEQFAQEHGLSFEPAGYFATPLRWDQLQEALHHDKLMLDHVDVPRSKEQAGLLAPRPLGTVGAVARSPEGHLAAATSTGGMTNKRFGRVGDSPIVGAGVYAWDQTCAVSATGHGEYFLRGVCAYDLSALVELAGMDLIAAAHRVIHERLNGLGGVGGVIALNAGGTLAMPYNTDGMYRGYVLEDGSRHAFIWETSA